MENIKIQINHEQPITLNVLATILYDEIGEEYNLDINDIEDFINFEYCNVLPNESFITIVSFSLPELELRDIESQEIVFSFLNSIKAFEGVLSITKINDTILQKKAYKYYQQIIDIEMDMRNVLTYILAYDNKTINEELFKSFGINKSEKLEHDKLDKSYENGLFYIYFNHYSEFTEPQKLKAEQITDFLQDPSVESFERFKEKIKRRGLEEERHLDFLASIKTKLKPLEGMRNAIMHIRNLSKSTIDNFEKAVEDHGSDRGVRTIIQKFWIKEQELLNQKTFKQLAKNAIENVLKHSTCETDKLVIDDDFPNPLDEAEYILLRHLNDDILFYIDDKINIINYDLNEDDLEEIKELVSSYWKID